MAFLKEYSELILVLVTLILVCITGWYAYLTNKIQKIMAIQQKLFEKQVLSDIQFSNVSIKCICHRSSREVNGVQTTFFWLRFELSFDIYNRSSANGSIDLPTLVLVHPLSSYIVTISPRMRDVISIAGGEKRNNIREIFSKEDDSFLLENISSFNVYIDTSDNLGINRRVKVDNWALDSNSFTEAGISVR